MPALLLAAVLTVGVAAEDGSLLFLENSNLFVELYTGSGVTHVAMVIHRQGEPWVYEATPSHVRRLKLDDYLVELGQLNARRKEGDKVRVWLLRPRDPYSSLQVTAMRELLESQIGRRYSVKSYVRGQSDGIHCAELTARTLCAASVLSLPRCQDESPAALWEKLKPLSRPPAVLTLSEPEPEPNWGARSWNRWTAFASWCSWSCWEAWTFCW